MMIDAAALFQSSMLHADSLNIQQLLRRAGIALVSHWYRNPSYMLLQNKAGPAVCFR